MKSLGNIALLMVLLGSVMKGGAQEYFFDYTPEDRAIYQDIIKLKLEKAQEKLTQKELSNSYNLSYLHLQSYLDFFAIFISEDKQYFDQAQKRKDRILASLKDKLPDSNPYKKFALAEVQLHSAINRSKFNQMLKSAREILSAYKLLKENSLQHPDFIYNKKSLSVIHSLAETVSIPGVIKKLFGIRGTIAQGLAEIESVIDYSHQNGNFLFKEEVDAIYLYILMYQVNNQVKALSYLASSRLDPRESLLSTFMVTKIYQRSGQNDIAISTLENKPKEEHQMTFHYLELMEGVARLRNLDPQCTTHIQKYIAEFKGRHFIKEAYQKFAWSELVFEEDIPGYKHFISKVRENGYALVDDDKQANRASESNQIPDPDLLKARLLSDGGYYQKAYSLLVQKAYKYFNSHHTLEFNYRMGRICQALKNYPEALEYFRLTIETGQATESYFACNAALQSGLIYESMKYDEKAEKYYNQSLGMNPADYKTSLHQKAKSGIMRMQELDKNQNEEAIK